jgi:hypothetical protein
VKIQQNSFNSLVINYYTYIQYLDLNLGFTTSLYSKYLVGNNYYIVGKNTRDSTTALHRVVSYPKLIKLGSTGSSTKRWGAVKKFKHVKNLKFQNKIQKIKFLKNIKSITKTTARALVITFKCNNFFPIKIGQEKIEIFTKIFDINLEMAMFKTALRTTIGRTNQKLGQENHFLQNLEGKFKYMQAPAQDQSRKIPHPWDNIATSTKNNNSLNYNSST